jgi:hypothetical protein
MGKRFTFWGHLALVGTGLVLFSCAPDTRNPIDQPSTQPSNQPITQPSPATRPVDAPISVSNAAVQLILVQAAAADPPAVATPPATPRPLETQPATSATQPCATQPCTQRSCSTRPCATQPCLSQRHWWHTFVERLYQMYSSKIDTLIGGLLATGVGLVGAFAYLFAVRAGLIDEALEKKLAATWNNHVFRNWFLFVFCGGLVAGVFQLGQGAVFAPIQAFVLGITWFSVVSRSANSQPGQLERVAQKKVASNLAAMLEKGTPDSGPTSD